MADYFTNFSLILNLPDPAAQSYALDLAHQAARMQLGDESPENLPAPLATVIEDWQFDIDPENQPDRWGIWLHSSHGGVDAVCAFIQHLLQTFTPHEAVALEWSFDCSKLRIDAFGGGAAIITSRIIKTMGTGEWVQKQTTRFLAQQARQRRSSAAAQT